MKNQNGKLTLNQFQETPKIVKLEKEISRNKIDWVNSHLGICDYSVGFFPFDEVSLVRTDCFVVNVADDYNADGKYDVKVPLTVGYIPESKLNVISDIIGMAIRRDKKVIVSCNAGQERGPLAVVWYLMNRGMQFENAYSLVKDVRKETSDVRSWIHFGE